MLWGDVHLRHSCEQHVQTLLTLTSTNDLPNLWKQTIHGRDRLAVVVETHVEGLDVLGPVGDEHGALDELLCEVALVFRRQVLPPARLELPLTILHRRKRLLRVGVRHAAEGSVDDHTESLAQPLVVELLEKRQLVRATFKDGSARVLEEALSKIHVVGEIRKGDFGFNHPKLRQVPGRMRVLGTEGGPECVHLGHGAGICLCFELAGHGEERRGREEVFGEVDLAVGLERQCLRVILEKS
mmetsp:Transcript_62946/g.149118  ORF Transcript_62946/g.149118 Transcript_62946/m.149118 type:complete len:241 (+) Transcript_62946:269-991(+)